jgi:hypothetical protein
MDQQVDRCAIGELKEQQPVARAPVMAKRPLPYFCHLSVSPLMTIATRVKRNGRAPPL